MLSKIFDCVSEESTRHNEVILLITKLKARNENYIKGIISPIDCTEKSQKIREAILLIDEIMSDDLVCRLLGITPEQKLSFL